jgi:pSer/pThr/pTyr-binding forkhead associated (FHA) protein
MAIFLEVRSGTEAGKKVPLRPGHAMRVGRTARADLTFADDSHMSSLHFSIENDGQGCRLTDLDSRNGTLVNGKHVKQELLKDGDTIVAGATVFAVRAEVEKALLAPTSVGAIPQGDETTEVPQDRVLALLRNDYQPLYAVLDAARDTRILALVLQYKEEFRSLYEGIQGGKLAQVAPYLVRLGKDSRLLEALVKEGWGKSWGVYLTSAAEFHDIRRHLRHFLQVKLPDGEQVYFRFYDPRVFLPTCTDEETTQFFGCVSTYVVESEEPDKLWEFTTIGHGAEKRIVTLMQPAGTDGTLITPAARAEPNMQI